MCFQGRAGGCGVGRRQEAAHADSPASGSGAHHTLASFSAYDGTACISATAESSRFAPFSYGIAAKHTDKIIRVRLLSRRACAVAPVPSCLYLKTRSYFFSGKMAPDCVGGGDHERRSHRQVLVAAAGVAEGGSGALLLTIML